MSSTQLGLLLWKHFTMQRRSLVGLLLKVTIPALFAIVFMPIRTQIISTPHPNDTQFDSFSLETDLDSSSKLEITKDSTFCYFSNSSDLTNRVMNRAAEFLRLNVASKFVLLYGLYMCYY